jgi:hypothetical protein
LSQIKGRLPKRSHYYVFLGVAVSRCRTIPLIALCVHILIALPIVGCAFVHALLTPR